MKLNLRIKFNDEDLLRSFEDSFFPNIFFLISDDIKFLGV